MESDICVTLEPGLRRIVAPNPSPMTYHGTNTYLIGDGDVVVIDPGPSIPAHLDAILATLAPHERIARILITHSHLDHSPLATPLNARTGAPVLAAGPSDWGRSPTMQALADNGLIGGGEGVDANFAPTDTLGEGDVVEGAWGRIDVLATPGHMANHLSFVWNDALFSGDLIMGWSTSLVSPPDGDMAAFMASTRRIAKRTDRVAYPGHGEPVPDPAKRAAELIAHRQGREAQILDALADHPGADAPTLARAIYDDVPPALLPAAARNVLAHLIDLHDRSQIRTDHNLTAESRFWHP